MPQKKKKRKKKTGSQPQKVKQAQHKNQFLKKFRHILSLVGCEELYSEISREEMDDFYMIHFRTIRVEPGKDLDTSTRLVKFYNWFFNHFIKERTIELYDRGPEISLYDFLTTIYTFEFYNEYIKSEDFDKIKQVNQQIRKFIDFDHLVEKALSVLATIRFLASVYHSDLVSGMYWFKTDVHFLGDVDQRSYIKLLLCKEPVQVLSLKLNGAFRPVYRLGHPLGVDITWLKIDARTMKMSSVGSEKEWDIYIQGHALKRLTERLDNQDRYLIYIDLLVSLIIPKVSVKDNRQRLIEFRIKGNYKIGYLLAEVVNDVVVIRTFLMLTHHNTPEGERLKAILNSTKTDTTYWALDRLSTFSASDMDKNEVLKQKFIEAGCETLFNIDFSRDGVSQKSIEQAEAMVKYFGLDEEDDRTRAGRQERTTERWSDSTNERRHVGATAREDDGTRER